jgi:hypothetical protein
MIISANPGNNPDRRDGPRMIPASISPTTDGCPRRVATSPIARATNNRIPTCRTRRKISWWGAAEKMSIVGWIMLEWIMLELISLVQDV